MTLADGILAFYDGDDAGAHALLQGVRADWDACANVAALAGVAALQSGELDEALGAFESLVDSPIRDLREFAALGLADAYLADGDAEKAESLYEGIVEGRAAMGMQAMAEFRLREGSRAEAETALESVKDSPCDDYWKGVGLAYLICLAQDDKAWRRCLGYARFARNLALSDFWRELLREKTRNALDGAIVDLTAGREDVEALLLAEAWEDWLPLLGAAPRVALAGAYRRQGLLLPALEMYRRNVALLDPPALLEAGQTAWACGEDATALEMLDAFLESGEARGATLSEARLIKACTLHRLGRPGEAAAWLDGPRNDVSPSILRAVGDVERALGKPDEAMRDYLLALRGARDLRPALRRNLQLCLASLCYEQGWYANAVEYCKSAQATTDTSVVEPVEVLSLLHLHREDAARERAEDTVGKPADVYFDEVFAAEKLLRELREKAYVR